MFAGNRTPEMLAQEHAYYARQAAAKEGKKKTKSHMDGLCGPRSRSLLSFFSLFALRLVLMCALFPSVPEPF